MKKALVVALTTLVYSHSVQAQSEIYPQHFDLKEVNLLEGPLKDAQDLNIRFLMSYDVDRLLTPFVRQAGLSATSDSKNRYYKWETNHPNFANWGSPDFDLSGHVGGHYLTALALAYASCHDVETKQNIRDRIDYMITVLKDCQDAYDEDKTGLYGFIGGQPMNANWQKLYKGDTDGFWNGAKPVPFYCQHKILAGLRDLALYTEDSGSFPRATMAREMFRKLCDWSLNVVSKLSDDALQRVLWTEHGGMNETIADAYVMFGDKKYLTGAKRYSDQGMKNGMQTLDKNFLSGKHANTQVPKYVGFARISQVTTASDYRTAARNFWADVVNNRTVCIGGNSVEEHFLGTDNCGAYIDNLDGPESCNTNNMLKLTEDLFDIYHDAKYADFYEAAMYNHILSTQDPTTGGYVYFTPLRPQSFRIYSKVNQDMWCCVGTGMENHVKYGHFVYTHEEKTTGNTLYVNLFTASTLNNEQYALTQQTQFPYEEGTTLTIDRDGEFTLAIRRPSWVAEGFSVSYNGEEQDVTGTKNASYFKLTKAFHKGDVIRISLPMQLRYEQCPNLKDYIAFKYGPILLGARTTKTSKTDDGNLEYAQLNHEYAQGERMGHAPGAYTAKYDLSTMPMLIGNRTEVLSRISPVDGQPLTFTIDVNRNEAPIGYAWSTLTLEPYFRLHHSRVNNYFYQATLDNFMNSTWAQAELEAKAIEERTVDQVDLGKQQSEAGVVTFSSDSGKGTYKDEDYRDTQANGWMEIVLTDTVADARDLSLMLRYQGDDKGRKCKIYVNGTLLKDYQVPNSVLRADGKNFYNLELPLGALAFDEEGNTLSRFVVRIVAGSTTANPGLYYIRLLKDYKQNEHTYQFKASDWAFTGDGGRIAQSKIQLDAVANTISMTQSGTNNICLRYGSNETYEVPMEQKYLVIRGTNLSTTAGNSYLWWLNGKNQGTSVAPTSTKKLKDGRTQLAWDISKSGIDANCQSDPWMLTTEYNSASTTFGLTAVSATKAVVISYIGFLSDAQMKGTEPEPLGDGLEAVVSDAANDDWYTLTGVRMSESTLTPGIYIHNNKKVVRR